MFLEEACLKVLLGHILEDAPDFMSFENIESYSLYSKKIMQRAFTEGSHTKVHFFLLLMLFFEIFMFVHLYPLGVKAMCHAG